MPQRTDRHGALRMAAARVKRCGKSAPRLRQRRRHGKPRREQNRIGTAPESARADARTLVQVAVRVGCLRRRATGVPEEWPSRAGFRLAPHRTRLTGRLTLNKDKARGQPPPGLVLFSFESGPLQFRSGHSPGFRVRCSAAPGMTASIELHRGAAPRNDDGCGGGAPSPPSFRDAPEGADPESSQIGSASAQARRQRAAGAPSKRSAWTEK